MSSPKKVAESLSDLLIKRSSLDSLLGRDWSKLGWWLLWLVGWVLILSGIFAIGIAATVRLLPHELSYLDVTTVELNRYYDGRLIKFMAHNRIIYGGALIALGLVSQWLAGNPVRSGEAWAWWILAFSGGVGSASFLNFLGNGYLDIWHSLATLVLSLIFCIGLILSFTTLRSPRHPGCLFRQGARAWIWSPAGIGRAYWLIWAFGGTVGGILIMTIGVADIFVPQDLEYICGTTRIFNPIPPDFVPFIAHDRAGFGGALLAGGMATFLTIWCGLRPGAQDLLVTLIVAWFVSLVTAIGVHFVIGYVSFIHLLPFVLKDLAFVGGLAFAFKAVVYGDPSADEFPDL